jgi:hypothetical protein
MPNAAVIYKKIVEYWPTINENKSYPFLIPPSKHLISKTRYGTL